MTHPTQSTSSHPPFVKLCGLRDLTTVPVVAAHATYAGIILAPQSRRAVSLALAQALCEALRDHGRDSGATATPVLVFASPTASEVLAAARFCGANHVQLHGEVSPDACSQLRAAGLFVVRALPAGQLAEAAPWYDVVDALLVDGDQPGGGVVGGDRLLNALADIPAQLPVWLAGGLQPDNLAQRYAAAMACTAGHRPPPVVVDAASALEQDGAPCHDRIHAFVAAARPLQVPRHQLEMGGAWVSELLMPAIERLRQAWQEASVDPGFAAELNRLLATWAGRPTPLYRSPALSQAAGCEVFLKREDLLHGGAHKTNNTLGQALLAKRMGCSQLIAETGAGQHGVATAMAGALIGLPVRVYMGAKDVERQAPNVQRMRLLGAEVIAVHQGSATLKDAINEAMRAWSHNPQEIFYVFGTAAGPAPYPEMVQALQRVIGDETKQQLHNLGLGQPAAVVACVGGGSNAAGAFAAFVPDPSVQLIAVEAGGLGLQSGAHGATLTFGTQGVVHGMATLLLQSPDGQLLEAHSVSAGLDYPGVGPQHARHVRTGRLRVETVSDQEALDAFAWLARTEGIIPALETAHAVAAVRKMGGQFKPSDVVVVCLSGRGDKDLAWVMAQTGHTLPAASDHAADARPKATAPNGVPDSCATAPASPPPAAVVAGPQAQASVLRPGARLAEALEARRTKGQGAFLPFLMLGDPDDAVTLSAARALAAAGADALELGLAFSDPPADGPVLQAAAARALAAGMHTQAALDLCRQIWAATRLPLSLLAYANPILQHGLERFCLDAARSGICALLVADVPLEHRAPFVHAARAAGLAFVALVSMETSADRARQVVTGASGFVYVAGQMGTTGERSQTDKRLGARLAELRQVTDLPLVVGFGLSQPIDIATVRQLGADGAIVGSAVVRKLHEALSADSGLGLSAFEAYVRELAEAAHQS